MKVIKDFFLKACIWIYINGGIFLEHLFVLFCILLLLISALICSSEFITYFSVMILIILAMAIIFPYIVKKKKCSEKEKAEKAISDQDEIKEKCGFICEDCSVGIGIFSPENCTDCGGMSIQSERESEG